ncbi:MAG: hypothetical protein ACRDTH_19740 [Pseudonocardiaceae bacterium]
MSGLPDYEQWHRRYDDHLGPVVAAAHGPELSPAGTRPVSRANPHPELLLR